MDSQATTTPIVCDMTSAPDTGPERMMGVPAAVHPDPHRPGTHRRRHPVPAAR